jgi:hypothetical protein
MYYIFHFCETIIISIAMSLLADRYKNCNHQYNRSLHVSYVPSFCI